MQTDAEMRPFFADKTLVRLATPISLNATELPETLSHIVPLHARAQVACLVRATHNQSDTSHTKDMYFAYHARAKSLIRDGHLIGYYFTERHNAISPALVLVFDCRPPMPIRFEKWPEYNDLLAKMQAKRLSLPETEQSPPCS